MFILDLRNVKIYLAEMGGPKIKVKYFGTYQRVCFYALKILK